MVSGEPVPGLPDDDVVARFGGAGSVVVLPGVLAQDATAVLERGRATLPDAGAQPPAASSSLASLSRRASWYSV